MSALSFDPSTGLTCLSCRVVFANGEIQREHYKTDWHRYNLQRKVADLPPVTLERFHQKVSLLGNNANQNVEQSVTFCGCCNKQFQSKNAFENHLNSKKHKENESRNATKETRTEASVTQIAKEATAVEQNEADIDVFMQKSESEGDDDSEGWVTDHGSDDEDDSDFDESKGIPVSSCLFCSFPSSSMENNLEHMSVRHGFFLPDAEYCKDIQGMLHYLGLKVGSGNLCLLCNEKGKRFHSVDACQKHMMDKGHCRVAHEGSDMLEFEDFYDYSSMYPEGEDDDKVTVTYDDYTLTLPSGAQVGHRSLMRYYRQRLKPVDNESKSMRQRDAVNKVIGQYKALGWTGTTGSLAVQRAKDIRFMKSLDSKHWMKLGIQSNKLFKSRGRSDQ